MLLQPWKKLMRSHLTFTRFPLFLKPTIAETKFVHFHYHSLHNSIQICMNLTTAEYLLTDTDI